MASAIVHGSDSSSLTYGYHHGGYPASNVISRWSFSSDGNAVDWADLTVGRFHNTGNQI